MSGCGSAAARAASAARGNRLVVQTFSTKCRLSLGRADRRQSNAAESYGGILTNVARHGELHGSAGAWIHGSAPLECKIGAAAALRRNLHFNFSYKFVVSERRCVGILDEVFQWMVRAPSGPRQ